MANFIQKTDGNTIAKSSCCGEPAKVVEQAKPAISYCGTSESASSTESCCGSTTQSNSCCS